MPCEFRWYIPNRVLYQRMYGEITLEELRGFNVESLQYVEQGQAPVHTLVDMREVTKYPMNLREISSQLLNDPGPKLGWVMVITNNPVLRFLASVVVQVAKVRTGVFPSIDEALAFVAKRDETLILP